MTRSGALFERLAAGLALTMLAAAVVLLLAGTVRNWASVVLALAGLLAATMGGWYTVSRHRTVRWLGLAFLVGSVVLFARGLLTADLRPVRVILTPLFAAASVGCARLALRRSRRASRNKAQDVPRPAYPVLIINPRSGGGKAVRFGLTYDCERRGIVPVVLRPGDDLTQLAETAIADGADVIGMAGGDGSQAGMEYEPVRGRIAITAGHRD